MDIVNWTFTMALCAIFTLPHTSQAAQKNNQSEQKTMDEKTLELAYQQLVLNHSHSKKEEQLETKQSTLKLRAISIAKKQLKIRYRWGGASPQRGFDCSGLIQYSFKKANISLPRTAASQYKKTKRIPISQLQQGDLIFFHTRRRNRVRVNHVGMYLGKNKFIHAPRRGKTVTIANLNSYWKRKIVGAGRI